MEQTDRKPPGSIHALSDDTYDAIVIGGGFMGCSIGLYLHQYFRKILILEKEPCLLGRASFANQARVHQGYHYPRSLLTGLRSRVNFQRFVGDYQDCIDQNFEAYYAISRVFSNVTAKQFTEFCVRIGAPLERDRSLNHLFRDDLVEEVFRVEESAFDARKLRDRIISDLESHSIEWQTDCAVRHISPQASLIELVCEREKDVISLSGTHVFNCTYANINQILANSGLPLLPLNYELAEIALVEVPAEFQHRGVTMMCGPFFSFMPFPPLKLHTLSHVRYTPHFMWTEREKTREEAAWSAVRAYPRRSNYPHMIQDVKRFLPPLAGCRYVDSLWEIKAKLPRSEADDSRPILFRKDHGGIRHFYCVLGGKIDNVYDIFDEIRDSIAH